MTIQTGIRARAAGKNTTVRSIHTKKFDDCVRDVKRKGNRYNPYAVCMSALGEERALRKAHRRKYIKRNPATGFLLAVKNTASGQRAYYTGEEPEAFDSNKMRGKVYASAAHAQAAMRMLLRDKTLKRGWKYAVVPATFTNPASGERLYTDFHGEPPRRIKTRQLPTFRRGLEIGPVVALTYDTKRDGKITRYEHEFDDRAAPLLIASDSGHELALTGGSYQFTDRGIQDRVGKLK